MFDLRTWRDDPVGALEHLTGDKWKVTYRGGAEYFGRNTSPNGRAAVVDGGWMASVDNYANVECGPETGEAGTVAASLALLKSRPVWDGGGYDLLLGRLPTVAEAEGHPGAWVVAWGGVQGQPGKLQRVTAYDMDKYTRNANVTPPLFVYPLALDGRPCRLGGGV